LAKIPKFLLKALYVKGSLQGNESGFEFQMKNEIGPVRIIGARFLQLNRRPIPMNQCRFILGDLEAGFEDVTDDHSVLMRKGEAVTVKVNGFPLKRGRYTLGIGVVVKDIGNVTFSISDQVK
jgi:hypothetical protein